MDYYNFSSVIFILRIFEFFSQFNLVLAISNAKISIKKTLLSSLLFASLFEIIKIFIPQYLI